MKNTKRLSRNGWSGRRRKNSQPAPSTAKVENGHRNTPGSDTLPERARISSASTARDRATQARKARKRNPRRDLFFIGGRLVVGGPVLLRRVHLPRFPADLFHGPAVGLARDDQQGQERTEKGDPGINPKYSGQAVGREFQRKSVPGVCRNESR